MPYALLAVSPYLLPLLAVPVFATAALILLFARRVLIRNRPLRPSHITPAIAAPQVFETMSDLLVVLDPNGMIRLTNGAADRAFGTGMPLVGRPASAILGAAFDAAHMTDLLRSATLRSDELVIGDGDEARTFSLSAGAMPGRAGVPEAIVLVARDITERKRAEARLAWDAFHDSLTGLANRTLFLERLALAQQRARNGREPYEYAVLFLDLDRFKVVNDSLGHSAGDQVLEVVARRLELRLREGDSAARLSGDEFALLLENVTTVRDVTRIAERIQADLAAPFEIGGRRVFVAASIGIALSTSGYETPEEVVRDADIAMYRAKAAGKARYEIFDAEMHATVLADMQIETDLRVAVEHGHFEVHYQPIVAVATQQIIGFEALVRWRHPAYGMIKPMFFIPMAEETGLIVPIGRFVMREACKQLRLWQHQFPDQTITMSINLSAKQFMQPDLVEDIAAIIGETGADPRRVRLEITESVLIENVHLATKIFHRLTALGLKLSMDDFGTGYSSLSNLHRFQMDMLKIDRSFVSEPGEQGQNWEIVRTIISLARNLGMSVVAEGVETEGQLAHLEGLACDNVQGFLFSRAVDGPAASELVRVGVREPESQRV